MKHVTVIDYGMSNLFSIVKALEHCGAEVKVTEKLGDLDRIDRLVLPGVGAFAEGMAELNKRGLVEEILRFAETDRPFLGICLGMQMMMESGEEFGIHKGISLFPGAVKKIPDARETGELLKVPHIGWNSLRYSDSSPTGKTFFESVPEGAYVYFVHSYAANPTNNEHVLATTRYGNHVVTAAIGRGAIVGCQFHPEKSGPTGLTLLKNFLA